MNDIKEELVSLCKDLRIASEVADKAFTIEAGSNLEFLKELLTFMKENRMANRQTIQIQRAKFPTLENFNEFDGSELEFMDEFTLEQCMNLEFVKKKENILMIGRSGTGKTMLSICIGYKACQSNIKTAFFNAIELAKGLEKKTDYKNYGSLLNRIERADLIILDRFAYTPMTAGQAEELYAVIAETERKKSLIITTMRPFSEWTHIIPDEKLAQAFASLCLANCHIINFFGVDHRLSDKLDRNKRISTSG